MDMTAEAPTFPDPKIDPLARALWALETANGAYVRTATLNPKGALVVRYPAEWDENPDRLARIRPLFDEAAKDHDDFVVIPGQVAEVTKTYAHSVSNAAKHLAYMAKLAKWIALYCEGQIQILDGPPLEGEPQ